MEQLTEETKNEIKNQIEYYLSDDNLKRDSFFHEKISEDKEGYLDINFLLKCNKIIAKKWTKENLLEGIKLSSEIELNNTQDKVRRKGNRALPELIFLKKKRKDDAADEEEDDKETNDPIILSVSVKTDNEVKTKWKNILDEFKILNPNLEVIYGRFHEKSGHFGVKIKKDDELKFTESFVLDDLTFNVTKCDGDDLIDFWKDHGSHFEMCVKSKNKNKKKSKEEKKKNSTHLKEPIKLGKDTYNDTILIKGAIRKILTKNKDDEPLKDNDNDFILDLLKFHPNHESKIKDMDHLTTGKPTKYKNSRCFLVIKKDGTKEDFSFEKCVVEILNQYKE